MIRSRPRQGLRVFPLRKARLLLVMCALVYTLAVIWSYVHVISPHFAYIGYTAREVPLRALLTAIFLAVVPSVWMPSSLGRPSHIVHWILYLLVFVPSLIVPLYALNFEIARYLLLWASLLMALAALRIMSILPLLSLPRVSMTSSSFWTLVALLSCTSYIWIIFVFGLQFNIVALTEVYDLRAEYRAELAAGSGMVAYAIGWQANILNPLLISYGMIKKKLLLVFTGILGQLFIFSITGFKGVLFSAFLLFALWIALRLSRGGRYIGLSMLGGATSVIMVACVLDSLRGTIFFSSLFIRRLIDTPGLLTGFYFEFFSEQPKALLGHSILGPFVDYPYSASPPFIIGTLYFGNPETSANANVWADGFANFGYLGFFMFTLLLGMVLWVFDSLSRGVDYRLACLLLGVPAITLSNTALLTSLLTHGIGLALLLMYLLPRKLRVAIPEGDVMVSSSSSNGGGLDLSPSRTARIGMEQ